MPLKVKSRGDTQGFIEGRGQSCAVVPMSIVIVSPCLIGPPLLESLGENAHKPVHCRRPVHDGSTATCHSSVSRPLQAYLFRHLGGHVHSPAEIPATCLLFLRPSAIYTLSLSLQPNRQWLWRSASRQPPAPPTSSETVCCFADLFNGGVLTFRVGS